MEYLHVPAILLPVTIVVELCGGLLVALGYQTRLAAFLLAGFSLVAGVLFHLAAANGLAAAITAAAGDAAKVADLGLLQQLQFIHFLKNITIAGGLLALVANGAGPISIDARRGKI